MNQRQGEHERPRGEDRRDDVAGDVGEDDALRIAERLLDLAAMRLGTNAISQSRVRRASISSTASG